MEQAFDEEINKNPSNFNELGWPEHIGWLIDQAKEKQKLQARVMELEYASKHNGELNEFLQKRKLPTNTLGRHVVDVVMGYVDELEMENKELKGLTQ